MDTHTQTKTEKKKKKTMLLLHQNKKRKRAQRTITEELEQILRSNGDDTSTVSPSSNNQTFKLNTNREEGRRCVLDHTGQTVHWTNGAVLWVEEYTGRVVMFCMSANCPDTKMCIGVLGDGPITKRIRHGQSVLHARMDERDVDVIRSQHRYIGTDPVFQLDLAEGMVLRRTWQDKVVTVEGPQGCGKSRWLQEIMFHLLGWKPGSKVVVVCPFTALVAQMTTQLMQSAANNNNDEVVIVNYRDEGVEKSTYWDILVCCPRSLKKFCFPRVDMLIVDEMTALHDQAVDWVDGTVETRTSISKCLDTLKGIMALADDVVLCCAQMTTETLERFLFMMEIPLSVPILRYVGVHPPEQTPVVRVHCFHVILSMIWTDVFMEDRRVVVCVGTAADAVRMQRWFAKEADALGEAPGRRRRKKSIAWTAAWLNQKNRKPARDVTGWLTSNKIDVIFHTNAMSPGMSIDHEEGYWGGRYMILPRMGYGPGERVMGQMPNRTRAVSDPTLYIFQPEICSSSSSSRRRRRRMPRKDAIEMTLRDYPDECVSTIDSEDGEVIEDLKPGPVNDARLAIRQDAQKNKNQVTIQGVIKYMDNAKLVNDDHSEMRARPCWLAVLAEEKKKKADAPVLHLTTEELQQMVARSTSSSPDSGGVLRQAINFNWIASTLPPEFVTSGKEEGFGTHLSPSVFQTVHNKYHQLENMQALASMGPLGMTTRRRTMYKQLQQVCGQQDEEDNLALQISRADRIATAIQLMLIATGTDKIDLSRIHANHEQLSVVKQEQAYGWVKKHWKFIRTLASKQCQFPIHTPQKTDGKEWEQTLRRLLLTQLGLGFRRRRRRGDNSNTIQIVASSIWVKLGIDVGKYIAWFARNFDGFKMKNFGILPSRKMICSVCGDTVMCVLQENEWRCVVSEHAHRRLDQPLQVAGYVDDDDDQHHQLQVVAPPPQLPLLLPPPPPPPSIEDRLLENLGFVGGMTSTLELTSKEIMAHWHHKRDLTAEECLHLEEKHEISLAPNENSTIRSLLKNVRKVMQRTKENLTIYRKGSYRKKARIHIFQIKSN